MCYFERFMSRHFLLAMAIFGSAFVAASADLRENQLANPSSKTNSGPRLQLLLSLGNGPTIFGSVKGLHGHMYTARDWRTPSLAQTNRVDILSSEDKTITVPNFGILSTSARTGPRICS